MKFYALVLLVVLLSVFELPSEAQDTEAQGTAKRGERFDKQKKEGNGTKETSSCWGRRRNTTNPTSNA
ncbi:hypothetical protein FQA39_LY09993 [Lamprigera yunnana]|nr:hypothetical protein FQA39_LY09993 [Lamprigera yunnana]